MDGHGGGGGGDQLDRCRLAPQSQHQSGQTLGIEEIEANRPAGSCGYTVTVSSLVTVHVTLFFGVIYQADHCLGGPRNGGWGNFAQLQKIQVK